MLRRRVVCERKRISGDFCYGVRYVGCIVGSCLDSPAKKAENKGRPLLQAPYGTLFYLTLENCSRLPVLITQIYITDDSKEKCGCRATEKMMRSTTKANGEVLEVVKNMPLPISIASLGGTSGWLVFEDRQGSYSDLTTDVSFEVHTNRGGSFRLKLPLCRPDDLRQIS